MRKILVFFLTLFLLGGAVRALDPIEDLQQQIDALTKAREQSISATKPLEGELNRLQTQLKAVENGINQAKENLRLLEISIAERQKEFGQNYVLLAERAASFYKNSRQNSGWLILFSGGPSGNLIRDMFYRRVTTDRDKNAIAEISTNLISLETDKKRLEADKERLAQLQVKYDKEAAFFAKEISGAKAYQQTLSRQIASLNAKQQQIIAQKLGSLNLPQSLGAGAMICTDDRKLDPGFGTGFAFFTYGIPHRVGMNQYGAYGRANAGKSYKEILNAYFSGISFEGGKQDIQIKVQGHDSMPLDKYLLGIYEMPESWPMEALKAQAVAARSYALAYTNNGEKEICTTQACQVWKPEEKTGQWKDAVEQTKGEVMMHGGQVATGWYSSTDGGYTFQNNEVWGGEHRPWTKRMQDTTGGVGSFSELNERAYDKDSKCFYAAQGWRGEFGNSAWLQPSEVADIANVILLARKDSSLRPHLYQVDKSNPEGAETWDMNKVKQELGGEAISSANSVEISADFGSGRTTQVTINGKSFSGGEFKDWFNLRAPANIQIVGPLYNVEKR